MERERGAGASSVVLYGIRLVIKKNKSVKKKV